MPCPVCTKVLGGDTDHRWCLVELFKTNRIKSVQEWKELSRPKTIRKGTIRAKIAQE
jgi:hypothetical protein